MTAFLNLNDACGKDQKYLWRDSHSREEELCDGLHDLVAPAEFKKREKHPWRNVNVSKVAGFSLQLY